MPDANHPAETPSPAAVLGWLEWMTLPQLGVPALQAKIDTGAKTSSLHADNLVEFEQDGAAWVRFTVPTRRGAVPCELPVHDQRNVRSSSGHEEHRVVVVAECVWAGHRWPIELTLTDRNRMRFPMLLGRRAMKGRFVVDPGRRYLGGRRKKKRGG